MKFKTFGLLATTLFLSSCNKPIPPIPANSRYQIDTDPFLEVYQNMLTPIKGMNFDSNQVSNKHLDQEMIDALMEVNRILKNPDQHLPQHSKQIKESGISIITIASASRSPWHQFRLSSKYKAKYLKSFHLLGLAVDLEMKGKPFDIKSHPENPQVQANYKLLSMILKHCGLVFSEPVKKDPNHVELFRYCKKKNASFDQRHLIQKQNRIIQAMIDICGRDEDVGFEKLESHQRLNKKRRFILLNDLKNELL